MPDFALFEKSTGRVMSNRSSSESWEQNEAYYLSDTIGMISGHATETQYVVNGKYAERPVITPPSASYDLTTLPPGTTVHVQNEAGDEMLITDMIEPLILTDPGIYTFRVDPPFPYIPINTEVEVI